MSAIEVKAGDYVVSKMNQILGVNDIKVEKHEVFIVNSTDKNVTNLWRKTGEEIKKTVVDNGRYRLPYKNEKLWGTLRIKGTTNASI